MLRVIVKYSEVKYRPEYNIEDTGYCSYRCFIIDSSKECGKLPTPKKIMYDVDGSVGMISWRDFVIADERIRNLKYLSRMQLVSELEEKLNKPPFHSQSASIVSQILTNMLNQYEINKSNSIKKSKGSCGCKWPFFTKSSSAKDEQNLFSVQNKF